MKFISTLIFLLAVLLFIAPTNAPAIIIIPPPTVSVNESTVTLTGTAASCGTGCTLYFIQPGTYGGLTIFNYSSTSLAAIKVVDGSNSDSLSLTNVILQNNTGAGGAFGITYQYTFSPISTASQNYQLLLSGLFGGTGTAGDSVSLSGQVSFDGGVADFNQIAVGTVSQIGQTVGSNLVGSVSPLKLGPVSITCPFTTPCTDTLIGDLFLSLNAGTTFKMSGSSALGECDPDFIDLCTAQFNEEVMSWQTVQTPEPGSLLLLISGIGALGLGFFGKKRFFK